MARTSVFIDNNEPLQIKPDSMLEMSEELNPSKNLTGVRLTTLSSSMSLATSTSTPLFVELSVHKYEMTVENPGQMLNPWRWVILRQKFVKLLVKFLPPFLPSYFPT